MNNTVVKLREQHETVAATIESFYNEYKLNSTATATAYKTDVEDFLVKSTPLGTETPLNTIADYFNYKTVTTYRSAEVNRGLQPSTVNRKITAIKEFTLHMKANGIDVDSNFFSSIKSLKGSSEPYEVISIAEGVMIADWLRVNEKFNAQEKYYYTLLALDTGVRADALSNVMPKDFIVLEDKVLMKGVDKGKKVFSKQISKELYEEMRANINMTATKKPLFNITAKNRRDMMIRALKGLGWDNRNITFHSLKKAAVNSAFENTGDIRVAMKVGAHSSMATTQRYLDGAGDEYVGAISNSNIEEIKNLDYSEYTQEELVTAAEQMSHNFQYQLKAILLENRK